MVKRRRGLHWSIGLLAGLLACGQNAEEQAPMAPRPTNSAEVSPPMPVQAPRPPAPTPCDAGKCPVEPSCNGPADCESGVCNAGVCAAPSPTDGIKNGLESDVDCGGAGNPKCATGKQCNGHGDCASDGCSYENKCIAFRSCTRHFGGDTCGYGGDGSLGPAQWESCCATAPSGNAWLDKYLVTAGRMRSFIDRTSGNVRKWVRDARAAGKIPANALMRPEWDLYLPIAMDGCDRTGTCAADELSDPASANPYVGIYTSAYRQLGGETFRGQGLQLHGCRVDSPGTHSYWLPPQVQAQYFADLPAEHPQELYDQRPLNCVTYLMAQAFCIWDGGRLETFAEWLAAWGPDEMPWGPGPTPWGPDSKSYYGNRFPFASDAMIADPPGPVPDGKTIEYANWRFSYESPVGIQSDYIVFLNPPGRLKGRGPAGHADIVGSMFEHTGDITTDTLDPSTATNRWTTNGTWQGHGFGKTIVYDAQFHLMNKYGAQGLRCAYDVLPQ